MHISKDCEIKYRVVPYCGPVWVYKLKKDAIQKYKEECDSDPTLGLVKTTTVTYTEVEVLR